MKLRLIVEEDEAAKRWSAYLPQLPGCSSAGDSEAEAVKKAQEVLEL